MVELVDTRDSKSRALKSVPVRVRPLVPNNKTPPLQRGGVFCFVLVVGEIGTPVRLIAHAIWTRSEAKALAQQVLIALRLLTSIRPRSLMQTHSHKNSAHAKRRFFLFCVGGRRDRHPGSTNCDSNLDAKRSEGACAASVNTP